MNNDRISNTPGGERMLAGAIIFLFGLVAYHALRFQLGDISRLLLLGVMLYGAVQFGRGLFQYKYADREIFAFMRQRQNLYIDVPLRDHDISMLHRIEDAVLLAVGKSKRIKMYGHTIDTPNMIGTIHLYGGQADAMLAQVYSVLAKFALPGGVHLFPKQGMAVDTAINGKRVLMDLPKREVSSS